MVKNEYTDFLKNFKTDYIKQEIKIINAYKHSADGIGLCNALSRLYDNSIKKIFDYIFYDDQDKITLAATGGYGRNEVCLRSDVDILFLERTKENNPEIDNKIQKILNFFWDINFDIGYSIKSFDECLSSFNNDNKTFSSILEIRYICGNKNTYNDFITKLYNFLYHEKSLSFTYSLIEETEKRHTKYGNSVKLLEPNIKYSAGGLRDLHVLLWLFRSLDPSLVYQTDNDPSSYGINYSGKQVEYHKDSNAITDLLLFLIRHNIITHGFCDQVLQAYNFLLITRNKIHYIEKTRSEYLNFKIQNTIAIELGYGGDNNEGVQRFMRDYYLHARKIYRLNQLICEQILDLITAQKHRRGKRKSLNSGFILNNDVLSLSNDNLDIFSETKSNIFKAFYYKCKYGIRFDDSIRNKIINSLDSLDEAFQHDQESASMFLKILSSPGNIAFTLNSMNELGVLGRYLPEFGKLIALYQHSEYHYYTTDEHTLIMIKKVEELINKDNFTAEIFREIKNKEVLFLAILFHDIGKIYSFKEHDNIGAEISILIMERMGLKQYFEEVYFLVQNHLQMEKIAFRRNCDDLYTLLDFAKSVKNITNLRNLYILTFADLSSVNPNVWTEWKETMLKDLYQKTYDIINNKTKINLIKEIRKNKIQNNKEKIKELLFPNVPTDTVEYYFDNMINTGYIFAFDDKEISKHIDLINTGRKISTIFNNKENFTELTIVSNDSHNLLSKICGVLTANDANIFDAKIFTGSNNIVIDSFRITNFLTDSFLDFEQSEKIKVDLEKAMNDEININNLLDLQKRKWHRKYMNMDFKSIPVDVGFEDEKKFTIIDIFTPDIIGLMYQFTWTFAEIGYSVYFAKASTYGDRSVCSFYLLTKDNRHISKEEKKALKERIVSIIKNAT
jgi:[protein-PII] uridylyltransferase